MLLFYSGVSWFASRAGAPNMELLETEMEKHSRDDMSGNTKEAPSANYMAAKAAPAGTDKLAKLIE